MFNICAMLNNESLVDSRWSKLCEYAISQDGYFSSSQAKDAGYSRPLLHHYLRKGWVERIRRGVYRIAHFPFGEQDDLVIDWLWTDRVGVISHDTALSLHRLSDILPNRRHFSVPLSWRRRRLRVPNGLVLHFGLPPEEHLSWYGSIRITKPLRTILDCEKKGLSLELLEQAEYEALKRGLFTKEDLVSAKEKQAQEV